MTPDDPPLFPIDRYARKQSWEYRGKGPNGRPLCFSGCGREVPKYRRTRCSEGCSRAWEIRSDPNVIRRIVEQRDHGICAICRVDTSRQAEIIRQTESVWMWLARREGEERLQRGELLDYEGKKAVAWGTTWDFARKEVADQLKEAGWDNGGVDHLWEADHIIPVSEGGGGCTPDGYRTLCLKCHRAETAKLAARLATGRRIAKQPELCL